MDKAKALHDGCKLPPVRGLKDFLLEPSGFQLPNFNDLEKWGNRVVNNLIYYQTNYFYMSLSIVLVIGCLHPSEMLLAVLCGVTVYFLVLYQNTAIAKFRREYSTLQTIGLILLMAYFVYILRSMLFILLFTTLLLFCVTFIHASLRLRNIKNKLVNRIEGMGIERTPMGIFLKYFAEDVTGLTMRAQH